MTKPRLGEAAGAVAARREAQREKERSAHARQVTYDGLAHTYGLDLAYASSLYWRTEGATFDFGSDPTVVRAMLTSPFGDPVLRVVTPFGSDTWSYDPPRFYTLDGRRVTARVAGDILDGATPPPAPAPRPVVTRSWWLSLLGLAPRVGS